MKYRTQFTVDIDTDDPVEAAKAALLVLRNTTGHLADVYPMPQGHPVRGDVVEVLVRDEPGQEMKAVMNELDQAVHVFEASSQAPTCDVCAFTEAEHPVEDALGRGTKACKTFVQER